VRYCRSWSFKVIEIGINGKPVCDFLLVFHCNCMSIIIVHAFITRAYSVVILNKRYNDLLCELYVSAFLPTPVSFEALASLTGLVSLDQRSYARPN